MVRMRVKVEERWYEVEVGEWKGDEVRVLVDEEPVMVRLSDVAEATSTEKSNFGGREASGEDAGDSVVRSPLPGVVLSIDVGVGDRVAAGSRVCVLEAMKMEQELTAPRDGRVKAVRVQKGQNVLIGQMILELE